MIILRNSRNMQYYAFIISENVNHAVAQQWMHCPWWKICQNSLLKTQINCIY